MPSATVTFKTGVQNVACWIDPTGQNSGKPPALVSLTGADGTVSVESANALTGAARARISFPPAYVQVKPATPAGAALYGVPCACALGASVVAEFKIDLVGSPVPPTPSQVNPPPPVVVQPPAQPTGTPAVQPPSPIRGLNIGSRSDAHGNIVSSAPANDPLGLAATKAVGGNSVRLWQYGEFNQPWPSNLLSQLKQYHAAGISVFLTLNFQNAVPRCKVGPLADLVKYVTALPDSSQIGSIIVGVGNEITPENNNGIYFSDSDANYLAALEAISPIIRAKGHKVALGSELDSQQVTARLLAGGAAPHVDFIDLHQYANDAAGCKAAYVKFIALAAQYGLIAISSELGMHRNFTDLAALAVEVQALVAVAIALGLPFWFFPLFQTNTTAGPEFLANQDGSLSLAGNAFKAGM